MRVTQEADYAIRMCLNLDSLGGKTGAAQLADIACITPKIALKVLRKLNEGGWKETEIASVVRVLKIGPEGVLAMFGQTLPRDVA